MATPMTIHANPAGAVAFGEQFGLYSILANDGPISAEDLATRSGLSLMHVSHWLSCQARAGYIVRNPRTGEYRCPGRFAEEVERVSA